MIPHRAQRFDWSRIAAEIFSRPRQLLSANALAAVAAVAMLPTPLILALMIDEVLFDQPGVLVHGIDAVTPAALAGPVWYLMVAFVLTVVLRSAGIVFTVMETRQSARIAKQVVFTLRKTILQHLERISMAEYETVGSGTVASHLVSDVNAVDDFVSAVISRALVAVLVIAGTAGVLLWMHWQLGLLILLVNPFVIYLTIALGRRVKRLKKTENKAYQLFQESISETLDAVQQVRAANRERFYLGRTIRSAVAVRRTSFRFQWRKEAANRLAHFVFMFGFDVFRVASMLMVLFSDLTIGEMIAVMSYLWFMVSPVQTLLELQFDFHAADGALDRINALLARRVEPQYPHLINPFRGVRSVAIALQDVKFAYGRGDPVLDGVSFEIGAGEKVSLVGASGSGKTTLVHIMLGLYPVSEGEVSFAGVPVEQIGLDVVRENVGTVLQQPALFNDTLRMNLTLGREMPESRLWDALEVAQLKETAERLSDGLDSVLGRNGVRLSGGQRQRLAIARLMLSDPKIVILDEATSALDAATERRLHEALNDFLKDRTTIVVAHRLSAIRQAHRVFVIEQGRIVQQGTHDDLIEATGHYAELYGQSQPATAG
jgi:ATP-binding cassette subfamily C protein